MEPLALDQRLGMELDRREPVLAPNGINADGIGSGAMTTKERRRACDRETYAWYKAHGICTRCRREEAEPGKTYCAECAMKRTELGAARWKSLSTETRRKISQKNGAQKRMLREQRKDAGLCVRCGRRKAAKGKLHCLDCLLRMRRTSRKYYDAKRVKTDYSDGLCRRCNEPALPGKQLCAKHLKIAQRTARAARKSMLTANHPWQRSNKAAFTPKKSSPQR